MTPFKNPDVARVFDGYPAKVRRPMLDLRQLIFDTAARTEGVGELEETLKWGEPAYVTAKTKSGTTVRIAWKAKHPERYGMYFHCQTNLVERFRALFPAELEFEGNRAVLLRVGTPPPRGALSVCVSAALTYHRDKRAEVAGPGSV